MIFFGLERGFQTIAQKSTFTAIAQDSLLEPRSRNLGWRRTARGRRRWKEEKERARRTKGVVGKFRKAKEVFINLVGLVMK